MNNSSRFTDESVIESRLGLQLAGALTARAERLPHDLSERLRFAREQAVARAREVRRVASPAAATVVMASGRGEALLGGPVPWWQRAASFMPLVILLAGLFAIDHWSTREQVLAAAEIDTQLLSDSLPPAAYSDPGFAEFLQSVPP